jgi:hypothetical protein
MPIDETYQPKVYREQGGETQVVANGGKISVQAGGQIIDPIISATTGAALSNAHGVHLVGSTGGATAYNFPTPVAGSLLTVAALGSTALGGSAVVTSTAAVIADSTKNWKVATLSKLGASVTLRGVTATKWALVGKSTGCALST